MSGTLHSASNDAATYTYAYDALDRVTDTTSTISSDPQSTVNLHEGYNRWGVRTSLKAMIGTTSDFENVYTYHHATGYLENIEQKGQTGGNAVIDKKVTFGYDVLGRWDTINCQVYDAGSTYADINGWVQVACTERDFDNASRVKEIRRYRSIDVDGESESTPYATLTYAYDSASQLTGVDYAASGQVSPGASEPATERRFKTSQFCLQLGM